MARLPRLVLPGHAHCLIQRALPGQAAFVDNTDRQRYLAHLHDATARHRLTLHAWALLDDEVQLLATPADTAALGLCMQDIGRSYVSAYNRRHTRRGTLWDGRYRAAVVEPGPLLLTMLALVDGQSSEPGWTSAAHRLGGERDPALTDPKEFWALGNTPFEREGAYRRHLTAPAPPETAATMRRLVLGGWPVAGASFASALAVGTGRSSRPRPAGRPRNDRA